MNLTIKKLPKSVQSLICASNQINSYTKAIQELVFNSLDADATSIAVRIHICEGFIQVVDNGCGISQADFKFIGQNYMTSKLVDISTLKSAPNKYGFQGQSLANLANISETLKVTSRFYKSETTCMKIFDNGKAKLTEKCCPRPSKGTTIEIKGFLYNLKIQKKSVDLIYELQNIKQFLEHISLVHSKISISLRDDAKNVIVYKIHKNREMYQTLHTLYEIDKTNVQELQIEKNQYKVKAYVGKHDVESTRHFIFLNGKLVPDSSLLHKQLNDNFKKYLRGNRKNIKKDQNNDDESYIFGNKIPFYFLFLSCPYIDYEMTNTVLEFKDWGQIKTLLDKLVKFYIGDMVLTKITPKNLNTGSKKQEPESTRNQIEKIMRKILGDHSKKPEISQMQNGVKGKLIKRKTKNQSKLKTNYSKGANIKQKSRSSEVIFDGSRHKNIIQEQKTIKTKTSKIQSKQTKNKNEKKKSILLTSLPETFQTSSVYKEITSKTKYLLPAKINGQKKVSQNQAKQKDKNKKNNNFKKKITLSNKFAQGTDSVKRRCEIVAQETKRLMMNFKRNPEVFINENIQCTRSKFTENNKQIAINKRVREIVIHEYIPLQTKDDVKLTKRKIPEKTSFKSNYDLLQTIISSQVCDLQKDNLAENDFKRNLIKTKNKNKMNTDFNIMTTSCKPDNDFLRRTLNNYVISTPEQNFRPFNRKSYIQSAMPEHKEIPYFEAFSDITCNKRAFDNSVNETDKSIKPCNMSNMLSLDKIRDLSRLETETFDSHDKPDLATSQDSSCPGISYHSHNYYYQDFRPKNNVDINHKKSRYFITTQSKNNFMINNYFKLKNKYKGNKTNLFSKLFRSHNTNYFNEHFTTDKNNKKDIRESYTIEFTESNEHDYTPINHKKINNNRHYSINNNTHKNFEALTQSMGYILNNPILDNESPNNLSRYCSPENNNTIDDLNNEPINENTYTVTVSRKNSDMVNNETYTIERSRVSNRESNKLEVPELRYTENKALIDTDFLFISKSIENINDEIVMNPIDVCETVLTDPVSIDNTGHFETNFEQGNSVSDLAVEEIERNIIINDSVNIDITKYFLPERVDPTQIKSQERNEEISHHFTIPDSIMSEFKRSLIMTTKVEDDNTVYALEPTKNDSIVILKTVEKKNETSAFNLKNRLFFVPKGMSPIFEEQRKIQQCEFNLTEEYYEEEIYNNFLDKVQNDAEIFKPRIGEGNDLTTKVINKVNDKLQKDKASLKFDGDSIKTLNVLGQVDRKFIAATLKSKSSNDEEFLVLFDQHAVHERIRLENNLADYVVDNQWKSVAIDEITFKMSRDNIIYLHNYRDKFTQFGLEWTILNYNEISIIAIPEGILGKNPRPVDKIIAAVKNLIAEEIHVIQMQRGCVSLYPKSIMGLVFSEACRYAIKFGDHLSKSQCVELLKSLSDCKTPFQCAHGRPAMAVIMNIDKYKDDYKANFSKLKQFKNNFKHY